MDSMPAQSRRAPASGHGLAVRILFAVSAYDHVALSQDGGALLLTVIRELCVNLEQLSAQIQSVHEACVYLFIPNDQPHAVEADSEGI